MFATPVLPQGASLVRDIGDFVPITWQEIVQRRVTTIRDGVAYFHFDDGIHGQELWRTDGTIGGTYLLLDLCPGLCGSAAPSVVDVAATDDGVFFLGNDGVHGAELWLTDGTAAGTRMVRDVYPGLRGSLPTPVTAVGDRAFFVAEDGVNGRQLWVSDGTEQGTRRLRGLSARFITSNIDLNGVFVFGVGSGPEQGLWRSDGTSEGTYRLAEVAPWQSNWPAGSPFEVVGGRLVFWGNVGVGGTGTLWATDGTPEGTLEIAALESPFGFHPVGDELYLAADGGRLFRTDGSAEGTTEIPLPEPLHIQTNLATRAEAAGLLFFVATTLDTSEGTGYELWASDGEAAWLVKDINPGIGSSTGLDLQTIYGGGTFVAGLGDRVVLLADDGVHGRELWVSDGTEEGTQLLADLTPGAASTQLDVFNSILPPVVLDDVLLFREWNPSFGAVLWRTDGTTLGTYPISLLNGQTSSFQPSARGLSVWRNLTIGDCLVPLNGGLLFAAWQEETGRELYFSDGSDAGTYRIADLSAEATGFQPLLPSTSDRNTPRGCRTINGIGVFDGSLAGEGGLLSTRGEPDDVELLAAQASAAFGPSLRFRGDLWIVGDGVLRTDGTPGGTLLEDPDLSGYEVASIGDRLLVSGEEVMLTDGPPESVVKLVPESGETLRFALGLRRVEGGLVFFPETEEQGREPWFTDGTSAGTRLLRDIRPGAKSGVPLPPGTEPLPPSPPFLDTASLGNRVVFVADDGLRGSELWVTDGTVEGTLLLADLIPGSLSSTPTDLTAFRGHVYFVAEAAGLGRELWRTNGLPGGTELVADLVPGSGSSLPQRLTALDGGLYFSVSTPAMGREPWRVVEEGATIRVAQVADIAPQSLSSSPLAFRRVGDTVFFPANDNTRGFELWKAIDPVILFADGFESGDTASWSEVAK